MQSIAAAAQNEDAAARLRLSIGAVSVKSVTEVTLADGGWVSATGRFNSAASSIITVEKASTKVEKVMAKSAVESAGKNGYLIATVTRVDSDKETQNSGTVDRAAGVEHRDSYTLFDQDGWGHVESGNSWPDSLLGTGAAQDFDAGKATSWFPLSPAVGKYYIDGLGRVWLGAGTEIIAAIPTVKVQRIFSEEGMKLSDFYKNCFEETANGAGKNVSFIHSDECSTAAGGDFILARNVAISIGKAGPLKTVEHIERIRVNRIRCGDAGQESWIDTVGTLLNACAQTIELLDFDGRTKETIDTTEVVTKMVKAADAKAEPNFDDADQGRME